jgi:hypothetical protein
MVALTACVRRPVRFLAGWSEPAQREKGPSLWNNFRRGVITAQSGDTNTPKNVSLWERKKSSMSTVLAFKSTKRSSPSIDGRDFQARTPRPTQYPQDLPASQTQSPAIIVGLCRIATSLWPHFVASPQRVPVYRYRRRGRAVVIFIYIAPPASKIAAIWATPRGRALRRMPGFVVLRPRNRNSGGDP